MELIETRGIEDKKTQTCGTAIIRFARYELTALRKLIEKEIIASDNLDAIRRWAKRYEEFEQIEAMINSLD